MKNMFARLAWLVATGLVVFAVPLDAQSRIAILDATGVSVLDASTGAVRARFPLQTDDDRRDDQPERP